MNRSELCFQTITRLAGLIERKEVSPVEVVDSILERIEAIDGKTNAFITVMSDEGSEAARLAEEEISRGLYRGPLHGIPVGLKDLYYTRDVRTTGGSKITEWAEFIPDEDSTVTKRLKEAGAVVIGKLNMHEFAAGGTNENPHYGPSRNPWNVDHMTGGSSGGSGAAVAASLCSAAMGSDTGGSVRIPASLCGIVGLKPTFGRVSCYGLIPLSWSMDHPGPMTKSVEDAAIVMNAIAGHDPKDASTARAPVPDYTEGLANGIVGTKIGLPTPYFFDGLDPEVGEAIGRAASLLGELGAVMEDVSLPIMEYSPHLRNTISMVEAAVYHERMTKTHADELTPNVRDRFELGLLLPASFYVKSQRVRKMVTDEFMDVLKRADVLVTPTISIPAPRIGQAKVSIGGKEEQVLEHLGRFTRPFNQTGFPACTVPCGFTSAGLPIGLQIVGRPFDESTVLRVAYAYEQAAGWTDRRPPL